MAKLSHLTRSEYRAHAELAGCSVECKIDRYKLADLVLYMHEQGKTSAEIADACNAELLARTVNQCFFRITVGNVHVFVSQFDRVRSKSRKRRFKDRHFEKFAKYSNVTEIAVDATERIMAEIDVVQECRDSDGTLRPDKMIQLTTLLDRLTAQLKATGELHKNITPKLSASMLRDAVLYFQDLVEAHGSMPVEYKKFVYDCLARSLLQERIIAQIEAEAEKS